MKQRGFAAPIRKKEAAHLVVLLLQLVLVVRGIRLAIVPARPAGAFAVHIIEALEAGILCDTFVIQWATH